MSLAYRQSYDCSKMKNTTINRAAHGLVNNRKISAKIGELLEEGRKRHDITVASLTEQLQDAYGLAMQPGHAAVPLRIHLSLPSLRSPPPCRRVHHLNCTMHSRRLYLPLFRNSLFAYTLPHPDCRLPLCMPNLCLCSHRWSHAANNTAKNLSLH